MAIKKSQERIKPQVTTTTNHYSDDPVSITRDVNDSLDKVGDKLDPETGSQSEEASMGGSSGSMRVIQDGKLYYLELKTKDGWIRSDNTSLSGFSFKN